MLRSDLVELRRKLNNALFIRLERRASRRRGAPWVWWLEERYQFLLEDLRFEFELRRWSGRQLLRLRRELRDELRLWQLCRSVNDPRWAEWQLAESSCTISLNLSLNEGGC